MLPRPEATDPLSLVVSRRTLARGCVSFCPKSRASLTPPHRRREKSATLKKRRKLSSRLCPSTARRTSPSPRPSLPPLCGSSSILSAASDARPPHITRHHRARCMPFGHGSAAATFTPLPLCALTRALQPWPLRLAGPHAAHHRSRRTHAGHLIPPCARNAPPPHPPGGRTIKPASAKRRPRNPSRASAPRRLKKVTKNAPSASVPCEESAKNPLKRAKIQRKKLDVGGVDLYNRRHPDTGRHERPGESRAAQVARNTP